jgi:hypothetical protein
MSIEYKINKPITTEQYTELLKSTTLSERRPIDDLACIAGMLSNSKSILVIQTINSVGFLGLNPELSAVNL